MPPAMTQEIESVKETYAAINRNDVEAAVKAFDPQIERIEPPGFPMSGTYRGHAAVLAHFTKARNTWAEGACEVERCIVAGDKIVALVHVRVRLKDQTEWIEGHLADVFTFRNGRAIQMRTFGKPQEALEWVGVKESDRS